MILQCLMSRECAVSSIDSRLRRREERGRGGRGRPWCSPRRGADHERVDPQGHRPRGALDGRGMMRKWALVRE